MILVNAVLFALAAFLASFLVLGAAWALGRARAAAVRHLIWTGAFAALLALPVAALLVPSQMTWFLPSAAAAPASAVPVAAAAAPASSIDTTDVIFAAAVLWLAGVVFHLAKLALGGIGLIRLHRRSVAHIPNDLDSTPFRGLVWQLRLRTSPSDAGPLTWGVVRPVVLLPKASVAWPREKLMSVLLHEAAHVRRKDCLCRLIAMAAAALYWPNPLVWFATRAMRADAERAADDAVITAGIKPTRYAEHLVGLAREFSATGFAMTLSMAESRGLDARVKSILDPAQSRTGVTKMDVLKLGVSALALTAGLALIRPSLAETPAPQEAAKTAAPTVQIQASDIAADRSKGPVKHPVFHTVTDSAHPGRVNVRVTDATEMPVPPAPPEPPDAASVPPAPPASEHLVPPVPPLPPQEPLRAAERAAMHAKIQAETHRAMAEARRALAEVDIAQTVRIAMKQAEQSMRDAKINEAQMKKAMAAIDVDRIVAQAMKQAGMALKADAAQMRADAAQARAEARRVILEKRAVNDKGYVVTDDVSESEN